MKLTIDYFELTVLIEASWHAGTILRYSIIEKAIDYWYNRLEDNDRARLYDFFKRDFEVKEEIQEIFMARYNPDNQYEVTTDFEGKINKYHCFKWCDEYHTDKKTSIKEKYITEITKI